MKEFDGSIVNALLPYHFASNDREYNAVMKKYDNPERGFPLEAHMGACLITIKEEDTGRIYMIVCMPVYEERTISESFSLLAHEAMHVWRTIRKHMGENKPSREFEAYSMQHICLNLFTAYSKALEKEAKKCKKKTKK